MDKCGYAYMPLQQDININQFSLIVQRLLKDEHRQDWNNVCLNIISTRKV